MSPVLAKFKAWWVRCMTCCDEDNVVEYRPTGGHPYNFRREDVSIAGLSEEEQSALRHRAIADASRIFASLQPLPNQHPSSTPGHASASAASSPRTSPPGGPPTTLASRLDRVKAHGRKLSAGLNLKNVGGHGHGHGQASYTSVGSGGDGGGGGGRYEGPYGSGGSYVSGGGKGSARPYEMRELLPRQASPGGLGVGMGKKSFGSGSDGESFSA